MTGVAAGRQRDRTPLLAASGRCHSQAASFIQSATAQQRLKSDAGVCVSDPAAAPAWPLRVTPSGRETLTGPCVRRLQLEPPAENIKAKQFRFNILFEPEATQEDVLSHSGW